MGPGGQRFLISLFNRLMESNVTYRQIHPDWQIIPETHATSPLGRPPLAHSPQLPALRLVSLRGNGSSRAKSVNYWPWCPRARGTTMGEKVGLGGSWMRSSLAARGARCLQRSVKSSSPSCPALTQTHWGPAWGGLDTVLGNAESVGRVVQSPASKCHSPEGGEARKKEILYPTRRDGEGLNGTFPIWSHWLSSCFSRRFWASATNKKLCRI